MLSLFLCLQRNPLFVLLYQALFLIVVVKVFHGTIGHKYITKGRRLMLRLLISMLMMLVELVELLGVVVCSILFKGLPR